MSLVWSYGITTVPSRFKTTLPTTLDSLAKAGFELPRLFMDGAITEPPAYLHKYPLTHRYPTTGAYGNWILSLLELYIRSPNADRYALFQDDMVTYIDLRKYLEATAYPKMGYLNLYTFPRNVQLGTEGWYRPVNRGLGAVALVFNNEAARALLAFPRTIDRIQDKDKGDRNIDGAVHDSMAKQGWHEYVHNPSLVQHIGNESTLGTDHNNQDLANTFKGETFNAMALVTPHNAPKTLARARVGLCGYLASTSLGKLNQAVTGHLQVARWLARPHKATPIELNPTTDIIVDPTGARLDKFVRHSDVVIFCGRPCYGNLIEVCQKYHRKVVCFKTPESMEGQPGIDLMLEVPTEWTQEVIDSYNKQIQELV